LIKKIPVYVGVGPRVICHGMVCPSFTATWQVKKHKYVVIPWMSYHGCHTMDVIPWMSYHGRHKGLRWVRVELDGMLTNSWKFVVWMSLTGMGPALWVLETSVIM
jgi:hypothetical protein